MFVCMTQMEHKYKVAGIVAAVGPAMIVIGGLTSKHSDHYKTSFRYDPQSRTYKMQMYSRISGKFENTVDELNAKQLSFDNLLVCFAPIERYSGDSGDVQQVSYISGGDAYYFSRGAVQHGRWEKASPEHPLLVYDKTGAQMLFNRGKTYLAIVDDDEWSSFSYQ